MTPETGQRFGPYEILSKLGGGAMGLVFRAWDDRLHREVAIKLLHDDYDMPGMRERFLQEARAASGLNHPHICTIFDIGEKDGEPYMVMELLEGETLKEKISRGALPAEDIVRYAQEVADALSAAHAKGIVHRDVKPANIFLVDKPNGKPQAKVLDFGLAKIGLTARGGRASRALDLTLAGATVGTLSYMSPEQARGLSLDERSDLFSLGVVMYEMATRQVPFQGATSALIFVQLLNHPPEPPHEWNESIPKELEKVILKLLAKDRDGRYQTANDLADALRKLSLKSGGWLKKTPAVVPLVRAEDPVARVKRPIRTNSELNRPPAGGTADAGKAILPVTAIASGNNMLIRPVTRMPQKEDGHRYEAVQRGERGSPKDAAKETVVNPIRSDRMEPQKGVLPGVEAGALKIAPLAEVIPVHNRAGVTRYEVDAVEPMARPEDPAIELAGRVKRVEAALETSETSLPAVKDRRIGLRMAVAALLAVVAGGVSFLVTSARFRPVLLQQGDPLLLTVIQNRTDDKALDGVVIEGLELLLRQSQYLKVRGGDAYRAGVRQAEVEAAGAPVSNRRLAQMVGAKAYLYGEIKGSGASYTISVDVLKSDTNDKLTSVEETADGKDGLAAAIDRLAGKLRVDLGESDRAVKNASAPLEREGTGQLEALGAYAKGESARQSGHIADAMAAYQRAITLDPKFSDAHIQLAWLYGAEKSEASAALQAELGQGASVDGSDRLRLLAQFCQAMNGSGDFGHAAGILRQFKERYPRDGAGQLGMSRMLRAEGRLPEALQAAQQAYGENPYDADAYIEAEAAMIGMDRFQGARQLEEQARHIGVVRGGNILAASYLGGDASTLEREIGAVQKMGTGDGKASVGWIYGRATQYGLYLDNQGRIAAGTTFWRSAATNAEGSPVLRSTQAYLFALGALDRALVNTCIPATGFAKQVKGLPTGQVASFNAGMASALCGDKADAERTIASLKQNFPQSTAVTGYFVADLEAAMALAAKDPRQALTALSEAAAYDQISLTPYLRGLAHLGTGEAPLAIADFQTIVDHRGATFIAGSNVYPMAQIGLARAYAAIGDKVNSTAAYRRFLELWKDSDRGLAVVTEASTKGR